MDVSKEYYPILEQCGMMRGIAPQCYGTVLFCLQARTIDYQRGVHVAEVGEATRCAGVLLRGGIEEFLYDENGNQITVAHIHEGQIFGAELACSGGVTSPVCLRTASACPVMMLNIGVLISESSMGCPCRPTACTPFHIPAPRWPIFSVWIEARFPANSAACAMKGYSPFRAAKSVCSILSFCMREQRRGAASVPYTPEFPNAKAMTTEKKT